MLIDTGQDGSFVIAAGTGRLSGPPRLVTVAPAAPRGSYRVICRSSEPETGDALHLDRNRFGGP